MEVPANPQQQKEKFEEGIALFRAGDFAAARGCFEAASRGPSADVAHSARMHTRMCDRRLSRASTTPRNSEEWYNYAVTLMNQGDWAAAENAVRQALDNHLDSASGAAHYHYALALCCGLQGKLEEAGRQLARSIELDPRNRAVARNDVDFRPLLNQSPIRELLQPERSASG